MDRITNGKKVHATQMKTWIDLVIMVTKLRFAEKKDVMKQQTI
ncbi:unnamed protein product [Acanthoscelides obtectus]|uniref:Uncharacterized protein n=1 Tax=Acanthoscelides obtectus TaxID=200917 RepID=A0A9P0LDH4_ACAOB|nr:unnamed protein product [Acanthoscelides obtectus]CAK1673335.1 hypothetical protein AOBTE_LOCUS29301 [Acanthoscelides obtectus]